MIFIEIQQSQFGTAARAWWPPKIYRSGFLNHIQSEEPYFMAEHVVGLLRGTGIHSSGTLGTEISVICSAMLMSVVCPFAILYLARASVVGQKPFPRSRRRVSAAGGASSFRRGHGQGLPTALTFPKALLEERTQQAPRSQSRNAAKDGSEAFRGGYTKK